MNPTEAAAPQAPVEQQPTTWIARVNLGRQMRDAGEKMVADALRERLDKIGEARWLKECENEWGWSRTTAYRHLNPKLMEAAREDARDKRANVPTVGTSESRLPDYSGAQLYRVTSAFLAALQGCGRFVAGLDDGRHVLRGVHVIFGDGAIRMEATDGHHLVSTTVEIEGEVPAADIVVPIDLVTRARPLFRSGLPVTFVISGQTETVGFYTDADREFGLPIEGKYVAFAEHLALILKNPRTTVVSAAILTKAVEAIATHTQHLIHHPVKLRFDPETKVLLVTDDAGRVEVTIENVPWEGEPFTIMVNSDNLLDFLALLKRKHEDTEVTLLFSDTPLSPMGITAGNWRGGILPLRPTAVDVEPGPPLTAEEPGPADPKPKKPTKLAHLRAVAPVTAAPLPLPSGSGWRPNQQEMPPNPMVPENRIYRLDLVLASLESAVRQLEQHPKALTPSRVEILGALWDRISVVLERYGNDGGVAEDNAATLEPAAVDGQGAAR